MTPSQHKAQRAKGAKIALKRAGGASALAKKMNAHPMCRGMKDLNRSQVQKWADLGVFSIYIPAVAAITGVSPTTLDPWVYPRSLFTESK